MGTGDFGPRYRGGTPIGSGGMSRVVRVHDRVRGEDVALKVLQSASPSVALSAEFRYIASLNHPGVVAVHDFGVTPAGEPYFTMELLPEGDLLDVAQRASLTNTLRTAREVFRTLDYVHARGIVHADLKPSNILLGRNRDGELYPKLLDFGMAWEDAADQHGGTVQFMAPELFMRGMERDHRSDLYAMGVVMYELLTGSVPFSAPSPVGVAQHHMTTAAPDPRDTAPHLPGELAELTLRLLEKQPRDRFARGRDVVAAIDAFLAKNPSRPVSRREPYVVAEPEIRVAGGSRFVGYEAELESLLAAATAAKEDGEASGRVVLVHGAEGSGKTRLLKELRVGVQLRGLAWLAADLGQARHGHEAVDKLASAVSAAGDRDIAGATRETGAAASDRLILDGERIGKALGEVAQRRPLVLTLEGLDGLDGEAAAAVRAFARHAARLGVVVVATARDMAHACARALVAIQEAITIELRRVSARACGEIVRSLLGEMEGADVVVEHVYRESGGNPGAIERVVHLLVATQAIVLRRDTWEVAAELGGELPSQSAETALRQIALARVDRLEAPCLEVAQVAAHIGESFSVGLLERIVEREKGELLDQLDRLVLEDVLEAGEGDVHGVTMRFGQRALREVLIENTAPSDARRYSELIVARLADAPAGGAPVTFAKHLIMLGRAAEAAEVAAAAMQADERPPTPLVEVLRQALAATEPGSAASDGGQPPLGLDRWCELTELLASVDRRAGRAEAAREGYRRVAEHAPEGREALAATARRELGVLLMAAGDEAGHDVLTEALAEARTLGLPELIGRAAYTLADRLTLAGRHQEATAHLSEALMMSDESEDRALRAQTLKLCATLHWLQGRLDDAVGYAERAVADYRDLGSPQGIAISLGALANVRYTRGQLEEARAAYEDALEHAHHAGWLTGIGKLENGLAAVAFQSSDWDAAVEHWDAALAIHERVGNRTGMVIQLQGRACVEMYRGEYEAARLNSERALELARTAGYAKAEADLLSNLGEISAHMGALDQAEELLADSIKIAQAVGSTAAEVEAQRRLLEVDLARHKGPLAIADAAEALLARASDASLKQEALHIRQVAGVALARARKAADAKRMLDEAHRGFDEIGSTYQAARTVRMMSELVADGYIIADGIESDLNKACRVFRRLRAQPELDAARRLRERLGLSVRFTSTQGPPALEERSTSRSTMPTLAGDTTDKIVGAAQRDPSPAVESAPPHESVMPPAGASLRAEPSSAPPASLPTPAPASSVRGVSLVEVSRQLSEILDLEELLACVVDAAIATSGAQRGFVIACDRAGQPSLRVSRGLGGLDIDDDLEMSRTAVGRVMATRQRVEWRRDAANRDQGLPAGLGESVMLLGLQAILALPLVNRGQLWGVLYLDTRQPRSGLTGDGAVALEALAAHAAVAIQNARLFEELGRKNELITAAVHQLRHPLDALERCASVAAEQASGTANESLSETIHDHAKKVTRMVDRLLELTTSEPSAVAGSMVSIQVRDLVEAASIQLQPLADIDEIELAVDVPWGLPTVLGHREQLIQVIVSVMGTALRRSEPGGKVTIEATAVDTLPPPSDVDPFFPPSQRELSGDGVQLEICYADVREAAGALDAIGLAIAREIVAYHGGRWRSERSAESTYQTILLPSLAMIPNRRAGGSSGMA